MTARSERTRPSTTYFGTWDFDELTTGQAFCRDIHRLTTGLVRGETLDLGCGNRVYYDTSAVTRWVGLDVAAGALDRIEFLGGRPEGAVTHEASCESLDFPDASFDTVCAMFLLHHLGRSNRKTSARRVLRTLGEARRVLRPGGRCVVAENAAEPLESVYHAAYFLAYPVAKRLLSIELPYFWTVGQMRRLARDAGFRSVEVERIPVREAIYAPVLRLQVPAWVSEMSSHMVLYTMHI